MTPFELTQLKHKIVFQTLDELARKSGYKDWNEMKFKNKVEKPQSFMIEELIRSALNKLDTEISSKASKSPNTKREDKEDGKN